MFHVLESCSPNVTKLNLNRILCSIHVHEKVCIFLKKSCLNILVKCVDNLVAAYWEIAVHSAYYMFSKYKYLIANF